MNPSVSVAVAVHNVAPYLEDCLRSIVNQSLRDLEIIVVDDASSDTSLTIAKDFAADDPRVRVVSHERNAGLGAARNTGLEAATGTYVAFVDGDDWLLQDALERARGRCVETGASVCLFSALDYHEDDGRLEPNPYTAVRVPNRTRMNANLLGVVCATTWSKLYERVPLIESGVRFPIGLRHEDEEFHFCYFARTEPLVATLDEPAYVYRQRAGSIMHEQRSERSDFPEILGNIWEYLEEERIAAGYPELLARMIRAQLVFVLPELREEVHASYYSRLRSLLERMSDSGRVNPLPDPIREVVATPFSSSVVERLRSIGQAEAKRWNGGGPVQRMKGALRRVVRGLGLGRGS